MRYKKHLLLGMLFSTVLLTVPFSVVHSEEISNSGSNTAQSNSDKKEFKGRIEYVDGIGGEEEINPGQLSLDTPPAVGNVLSTIIYSQAAERSGKNAYIPFSDMENYARPLSKSSYYSYSYPLTAVEGTEDQAGYVLAQRLDRLQNEGVLVTYRERQGLLGFWDKSTNAVKKFTKSVGTVWTTNVTSGATLIFEPIGNLAQEASNIILDVSTSLTPTTLLYKINEVDFGDSDISEVLNIVVGEIFGTGETYPKILRAIVVISAGFFTVVGIVSAYYHFGRGRVSESFGAIRKYSFVVIVPVLFTATLPSYAVFRQQISDSISLAKQDSTTKLEDSLIIDVKKWAFVSNFSMSSGIGEAPISTKHIEVLNADLNNRLGDSSVARQFDNDASILDKLFGGETFTADEYISFIQKASKKNILENTAIQANETPNGLAWGSRTEGTFYVNRYNPLHPYVGDQVYTYGLAKFADNITSSSDSSSSEDGVLDKEELVSTGGEDNNISYNAKNYSFKEVRRSAAWTYIYGARANGSYMSSMVDNYTFGPSLTLADDLTEKVGKAIKAEGSDKQAEEGTVADGNKSNAYYVQLANALKIGMFNRFAGMSITRDANVLSNQSTFFLLSSHLTDDGLELFLKNNNFNNQDKGKAGSNVEVFYNRYVMPATDDKDFFAKFATISTQSLATTVLSIGALIAIVKTNLGALVFPIWGYLKNIYLKGSIFSASMFYISDMTLILLKNYSRLVLTSFYRMFGSIASKINNEGLFNSTTAMVATVVLGLVAGLLVYPFFSVKGGKKQSLIELFLSIVVVLRDSAVQPLQKLENTLYGHNFDQGNVGQDSDFSLGSGASKGVDVGRQASRKAQGVVSSLVSGVATAGGMALGAKMFGKAVSGGGTANKKTLAERLGLKGRSDVQAKPATDPSVQEKGDGKQTPTETDFESNQVPQPVGEVEQSYEPGQFPGQQPGQQPTRQSSQQPGLQVKEDSHGSYVLPTMSGNVGASEEHVYQHKDIFAGKDFKDVRSSSRPSGLLKKTKVGQAVSKTVDVAQKGGKVLYNTASAVDVASRTAIKFAVADTETKVEMAKVGQAKAGQLIKTGVSKASQVATAPVRTVQGKVQEVKDKVQEVKDRAEHQVQTKATKQAQAEVFRQSDYNKVLYLAKQNDVSGLRAMDVTKLDLSAQERGELQRLKQALTQENTKNIEIEKRVFKEVKAKYGLSALGGNTIQGQEAYNKYRDEIKSMVQERQQTAAKNYKSTVIVKEMATSFDDKVLEIKPIKEQEVRTEHSLWNESQGNETLTGMINFAKNIRDTQLED